MQAVEATGLELWQTLRAEVHHFSYASCMFSGMPNPYFNKIIVHQKLTQENIQNIEHLTTTKNLPYSWMVPSGISLGEVTVKHFFPSVLMTSMEINLDITPTELSKSLIRIDQVSSLDALKSSLEIWKESFFVNDAAHKLQLERVSWEFQRKKSPILFFLGYFEKEPISCGWLLLGKEHAGIYNIGTRQKFRKQGAATQMMHRVVFEARKRGYKKAVLSALPEAKSIYERMGFESLNSYTLYLPKSVK